MVLEDAMDLYTMTLWLTIVFSIAEDIPQLALQTILILRAGIFIYIFLYLLLFALQTMKTE